MKILHICPTYFPAKGGAETHSAKISEGLAARGHQVSVLTPDVSSYHFLWIAPSGKLPREETIHGVRVERLQPDGGVSGWLLRMWQELPGGYRTLMMLCGPDGLEALTRKPHVPGLFFRLLAQRFDVVSVINWHWPVAYYAYLARRVRKFTLVGIPLFHIDEPCWSSALQKRMLVSCNAVITNTSYEAYYVRQQAEVRVESIGVGIEPSEFASRSVNDFRELYQLGSFPVVGYIGRLHPNKGVATLIYALKIVWKSKPDVRLVLAGPRATLDNEIVEILNSLSTSEQKKIICIYDFPESHKQAIYSAFDVFAMVSIAESFGISYLEAWMCGKPVVGARINQIQCVIEDGVDGLLVNPANPTELAVALLELLSDSSRREEMAERGRKKTLSRFTWDKIIDKVECLYSRLQNHSGLAVDQGSGAANRADGRGAQQLPAK